MQLIDDIIEANLGLVFAQINRLKLRGDAEAESIGYEALYRAITTYDKSQGYALSTYATCCIYNALGSYIRTLNKKRQLDIVSYNNIAYSEDGVDHEFVELITDGEDCLDKILSKEAQSKITEAYKAMYNKLTNERHKVIIHTWYASECTMSNKEIASIAGCSQPYVNQVINMFKNTLQKELEDYYERSR